MKSRILLAIAATCLIGLAGIFIYICWLMGGFGAAYFAFAMGGIGVIGGLLWSAGFDRTPRSI